MSNENLNNWINGIQNTLKSNDLDKIQMIVGGICIEMKAYLQECGWDEVIEYVPCWRSRYTNLIGGLSEETIEACEERLQERIDYSGYDDIKHEIRRVQTTVVKSYWLKGDLGK